MLIKQHDWTKGIVKQMVQDSIEALLRQKLGLDANSVGSRLIERAVEQRQIACQMTDRAAYLAHLRSSPDEMNQLVEAVVVPETWFFRDKEPFEYLRQYVKQFVKTEYQRSSGETFRVLSLPCSTGEEPYSIAITLLEAGLKPAQFQVDAIDVSQQALLQAQRGIYRKRSFRGGAVQHLEQYFQPQINQPQINQPQDGYAVRSVVQESVKFRQGNVLDANLLLGKQYHAIFCRNLLIYLDETARRQVMTSLDRALLPLGILFLGSAETSQINHQITPQTYQPIDHPFAFAFQKLPHPPAPPLPRPPAPLLPASPPSDSPKLPRPKIRLPHPETPVPPLTHSPLPTPHSPLPLLETAQQLADRGELTQAAQLCESFLRVNPTQPIAYLLLGQICQGLNQTHQAERCFQKAVYLNPNDYEALIYLALLKEQQGNHAEAERLRRRAQRLVDQRQGDQGDGRGRSGDEGSSG